MIKRIQTLVLGVQESVLVHFRSQNKVKYLHEVRTCQNCLYQKISYKSKQIHIFSLFFEFLSCY